MKPHLASFTLRQKKVASARLSAVRSLVGHQQQEQGAAQNPGLTKARGTPQISLAGRLLPDSKGVARKPGGPSHQVPGTKRSRKGLLPP